MEIDNKITVTLSAEDIEQACKEFACKEFDGGNRPAFENIEMPKISGPVVIIYKGYC